MKNGFTLIELLAVIVILAIIVLIATPIVLDIIKNSKLSSVKRSSELYLKAVELTVANSKLHKEGLTTCNKIEDGKLICGENKYKVEVQGKHPEYMEVKIDPEGQIYFAMKSDGYCLTKTENDKSIKYKKIVNNVLNSDKEIKENMCTLNPHTTEACFEFDSSTGTITNYYKNENNDKTKPACPKDVVIPSSINELDVKIIGTRAFSGYGLTSVIIPNSVTTIKESAFVDNYIKDLVIPEGVKTIGTTAFVRCQIENLSLPSTLISLAADVFRGNKLPEEKAYIYKRNNDGSIDYSTIIGYGGDLTDIVIPSEKNGVKLTTIGTRAFYGYNLTNVEIPNTVITIGEQAFVDNSIKDLVIPEGVKEIRKSAFVRCQIENLSLPSTLISLAADVFRGNKLPEEKAYIYKRNSDGSIDYSTIIGYGGNLKNIVIPGKKNGVKLTTIEESAFWNVGLISVEVPSTVTMIKSKAFLNNSLTSVIIKNTSDKVSLGSECFGTFDINQVNWEPVVE